MTVQRRSLVILVLGLLGVFCGGSTAEAQSARRHTPLFESERDPAGGPGLLGKSYVDAQYLRMSVPEELRPIDEAISGFAASFNVPTPWNSALPHSLNQDILVSGLGAYLEGAGSDQGIPWSFRTDLHSLGFGINNYLELTSSVRPFVQTGVTLQRNSVEIGAFGLSMTDRDYESRVLVNPGFEMDLHSHVAMRAMLELDTKEGFNDSLYRTELVGWVNPHVFLRGGLIGQVNGDSTGGIVGAGLAW